MKIFCRALLSLLTFGVLCSLSPAQAETDHGVKSGQILDKIRQIDLANHILPIIFTKDQINAILPAIEKARQNVKITEEREYLFLLKYEGQITDVLNKAINDGTLPGRKLISDLDNSFAAMDDIRKVVGKDNEDLVYKALASTINTGQRKAMANSLNMAVLEPTMKADAMSEDEKVRYYIRNILLDPLAYDLLVKLSRSSATPTK